MSDSKKNVEVKDCVIIISTAGNFNSAYGHESGEAVTTGQYNVYMGFVAGIANTTGDNNVVLGNAAATNSLSGDHNVAIGCGALLNNWGGCDNIALGNSKSEIKQPIANGINKPKSSIATACITGP